VRKAKTTRENAVLWRWKEGRRVRQVLKAFYVRPPKIEVKFKIYVGYLSGRISFFLTAKHKINRCI